MSNPNSSTSVVDISVKPQPTTVTSINTRKRRIIFYSCIGIVVAAAIIVGVIFGWYMKRSDRAVRQTVVNQPTSASFYRYNTPANESETAINAFQFDEISGELVWMSASGQFNLVPYSKIDTESGNTYFPTSIIDIVSTNGSSSTVIDMGIISSNPSAKSISSAVMFQDGSVAVCK